MATGNQDELEAKEIADRLKVEWAELQARAKKNVETIDGWDILKQARYEEFQQAERAEEDRREANVQRMAPGDWQPQQVYSVKTDPWVDILTGVEGARFDDEVRVFSQELMTLKLGIPASGQHSGIQRRLADCMRQLGWQGPKQMRISGKCGRGFWRSVVMTP
jgi:hypothetical protein